MARVKLISILQKLHLRVRNSYGNDSNGFGKLIACSLWEKYDFFDFRLIWVPNYHFTIRAPIKTMKLWDFRRFSIVLQRKMVIFKSLLKCWHATHEHYEAFLRRSKTFPSVGDEFGRTVPVNTTPLRAPANIKLNFFRGAPPERYTRRQSK